MPLPGRGRPPGRVSSAPCRLQATPLLPPPCHAMPLLPRPCCALWAPCSHLAMPHTLRHASPALAMPFHALPCPAPPHLVPVQPSLSLPWPCLATPATCPPHTCLQPKHMLPLHACRRPAAVSRRFRRLFYSILALWRDITIEAGAAVALLGPDRLEEWRSAQAALLRRTAGMAQSVHLRTGGPSPSAPDVPPAAWQSVGTAMGSLLAALLCMCPPPFPRAPRQPRSGACARWCCLAAQLWMGRALPASCRRCCPAAAAERPNPEGLRPLPRECWARRRPKPGSAPHISGHGRLQPGAAAGWRVPGRCGCQPAARMHAWPCWSRGLPWWRLLRTSTRRAAAPRAAIACHLHA